MSRSKAQIKLTSDAPAVEAMQEVTTALARLSPRILIFTPLLRSYGRAITSTHRMLKATPHPVEWLCLHGDQPYGGYDQRNVLHLYEQARDRFLSGPYTHLLCLEDDMVVPPDALTKLLETGAPVAYGLYTWRRFGHPWSAYKILANDNGISWSEDSPWKAAEWFRQQAIVDTQGVGLGCTLIERSVLEAIPFRLFNSTGEGPCNDWTLAYDCQAHGFRQVHHFGVVCGHITPQPSARVIWPDVDEMDRASYRYELFEVA